MYKIRSTKKRANVMRFRKTLNGQKIDSFGQQYLIDDVNPIGQNIGSLVFAQNIEWLRTTSGAIPVQTMRGSTLLCDTTYPVKGASFFNVTGTDYPVWHDNQGNLNYYATSIQSINTGLATAYETVFQPYNETASPVLFGANGSDGLYKIDSSFVHSSVDSDPTTCLCYSGTAKRLFRSHNNIVKYSDQQLLTGTTDLETFGASSNFTPGINDATTVTEITDDGKIVWFWMDTGIWGLLNPEDDTTNWIIPKAVSDVGTVSRKTIQYVKYNNQAGYLFLATDKTLRFFAAELSSNTGTVPILKDYGSITISNSFASLLKKIPDAFLNICAAIYTDSKYILSFVGEGGTELDTCIMLDLEKLDSNGSPYWCYVTNMDNSHYIKNSRSEGYAIHKDGWISKLLVNGTYTHQRPERAEVVYNDDLTSSGIRTIAIPTRFYMYYFQVSETLSQMFDCVVFWKSGGYWAINMHITAVTEGDIISDPSDDADLTIEVSPANTGNSFYDISHFDFDGYSGASNFSWQNTGAQIMGNYYSIGFENLNRGEWFTVFSIQTKMHLMKSSPMNNNI